MEREQSEDWKPPPALASGSGLPQQHGQIANPFQQHQSDTILPNVRLTSSSSLGNMKLTIQWPTNIDTKQFDTSMFQLPQSHQAVNNNIQNLPQLPIDNTTPASLPSVQSVQSHAESSNSGHSPNTRKRRREGDGARRIVVASFSNETDALEILANAATDDKKDQFGEHNEQDRASGGRKVTFEDKVGARLDEFVLVKQRVLDVTRLELLVRVFFEHHHPALVSNMYDQRCEQSLMVVASVPDRSHTPVQFSARPPLPDRAIPNLGTRGRRICAPSRRRYEGDPRTDMGYYPRRH